MVANMDTNSNTPVIANRDKDQPIDDGRFLYKIPEFLDTELTLLSRFTATVSVWASCVLLFITSLLFIVAFSITKWGVVVSDVTGDVTEFGLWQACDVSTGDCWSLVGAETTTNAYQVCQAFASLSMTSMLMSTLPLIIYCAYSDLQDFRSLRVITLFSRTFTAIFLLVTFTVYSHTWYKPLYDNPDHETRLSHSYKLTIAAFSFECLASVLVLTAMRSKALEVRLKKEQAIQEARDKIIARSYSDEPIESDDVPFEYANQVSAMSPYEAFRRYSAMDTYNEYDEHPSNSHPGYSNATYIETTDVTKHNTHEPLEQNKHVIQAEINMPRSNRYIIGAESETPQKPLKVDTHDYSHRPHVNHSYAKPRDNNKPYYTEYTMTDDHLKGAEPGDRSQYMMRANDNVQYTEPNMASPRSVENVPDGSSAPPTPRTERHHGHHPSVNNIQPHSIGSNGNPSDVDYTHKQSGAIPKDPKRRSKRGKRKAPGAPSESQSTHSTNTGTRDQNTGYDQVNTKSKHRHKKTAQGPSDDRVQMYPSNLDSNKKSYHGSHASLQTKDVQFSPLETPRKVLNQSYSDVQNNSQYFKGTAI